MIKTSNTLGIELLQPDKRNLMKRTANIKLNGERLNVLFSSKIDLKTVSKDTHLQGTHIHGHSPPWAHTSTDTHFHGHPPPRYSPPWTLTSKAFTSMDTHLQGTHLHGHSSPRALTSQEVQYSKHQLSTFFMPDIFPPILTEG